jgi:hypothetical protein
LDHPGHNRPVQRCFGNLELVGGLGHSPEILEPRPIGFGLKISVYSAEATAGSLLLRCYCASAIEDIALCLGRVLARFRDGFEEMCRMANVSVFND